MPYCSRNASTARAITIRTLTTVVFTIARPPALWRSTCVISSRLHPSTATLARRHSETAATAQAVLGMAGARISPRNAKKSMRPRFLFASSLRFCCACSASSRACTSDNWVSSISKS